MTVQRKDDVLHVHFAASLYLSFSEDEARELVAALEAALNRTGDDLGRFGLGRRLV